MLILIAKRFGQSILILLGVTLITFTLSFMMPADPVRMIAGRSATQETVESIRRELGLDNRYRYNTSNTFKTGSNGSWPLLQTKPR